MVCVPIFPEDPYRTTKNPCNDQGRTAFSSCNLAGSGAMKSKALFLACLFGAVCGTPAFALSIPGQSHVAGILQYPGAPKPAYDAPRASPYAMTYVEEAAHSLGVRNGRMDIFSTQPSSSSSYLPSISGGVGGDGAMLKLRWHPGE